MLITIRTRRTLSVITSSRDRSQAKRGHRGFFDRIVHNGHRVTAAGRFILYRMPAHHDKPKIVRVKVQRSTKSATGGVV